MTKNKLVSIRTFGCQMNVRDSEIICGLLKKKGYALADDPDRADIVLFNTCSVRQHAEDKVWSEIGTYKNGKIIGIVGCMAQNYKNRIFERAPKVSFVVGPSDIHKLPEIIEKVTQKIGRVPKERGESLFLRKIWETEGVIRPDEIYHSGFYEDKEHAYVVISEGCSNYCSYCVVPYVRGESHNRGYQEVLKEIEEAVDKGIKKITLLGQNVNAYKSPGHPASPAGGQAAKSQVDFMKLLELVNNIEGLKEFSFITSHPKDTTVDLFRVMAGLEKLKKYLHLPVQSGSDRVLKLMNRAYDRKFYLELAKNYRKILRNAALTTDIIVGFPTETEADFLDTYNLVKEVEFDSAYIFKYSVRPHTSAANLPDDVERKEKERRHALILELQKEISKRKR